MKHMYCIPLMLALGLVSSTIHASNWQWLHSSSLGDLSETDWAAMSQTLEEALDTAADGESRSWRNPESGQQGEITVLNTLEDTETPCRQVRFSPDRNAGRDGKPLTFCRGTGKKWLIRSPSSGK
jgi:surface antigen